jgi:predicted PilT family ATPase
MLSKNRHEFYQKLSFQLQHLERTATQGNLVRAELVTELRRMSQWFGEEVINLNLQESESLPEIQQSYLTEMHRLFRLLAMDVTFLQVSRQSTTTEKRLEMINDRVQTLLRYCEALLGEHK